MLVWSAHLRRLQWAAEKNADFEELLIWTDKEVAGFAREHDRFVRGVDALIAERHRGLAEPLLGIAKIVVEICVSAAPVWSNSHGPRHARSTACSGSTDDVPCLIV